MLMDPIMVPALFGVWKVGALEAQVSNFTPFVSQIQNSKTTFVPKLPVTVLKSKLFGFVDTTVSGTCGWHMKQHFQNPSHTKVA